MKKCLLLAVVLITLALAGCGGKEQAVLPRATAPVPVPVAVSVPGPLATGETHVLYAYHLLRAHYVDEVEGAPLLAAAWDGALKAATRMLEPPPGIRPSLAADGPGAEASLAAAIRTLLSLAPDASSRDMIALEAIDAMAEALDDDHTYFMRPEAYELYQANATVGLSYSGVKQGSGLLAWYVYEDGPAAAAGLRTGDVILTVNGRPAAPEADDEDREPSPEGVPVSLRVLRPGAGEFDMVATPRRTQRRTLDGRLIGDVAYLRLYRFPPPQTVMPDGQALPQYLEQLMLELRLRGAKGWVLDLRNNPGGSEIVAANVAGRFGLSGALVENRRRGDQRATIDAIGAAATADLPLAILINRNSASSSELLSQALQQSGLARLFGEKTAGIVNTSRTWGVAGGGLFITTERAYAGPGRQYLDKLGVGPDEAVSLSPAELARGRDAQLELALEWLRSRTDAAAGVR